MGASDAHWEASLCPGANDGGPDQAGVGDAEGGGGSEH